MDTSLPNNFKSWCSMWCELKKDNLCDEKFIKFHSIDRSYLSGAVHLHEFEIDFIKARCFDELKDTEFTIEDYDKIFHSLYSNRLIVKNDSLDTKIKNAIENIYQLGQIQ